jgi:hypothetical protein
MRLPKEDKRGRTEQRGGRGSLMVRLGIEFLELELNSNFIYKYRGKKLCLGVELRLKNIIF